MGFFGNISVGSSGEGGSTTIINTPASHTVNTIAERDALNAIRGAVVYVEDATADPTVESGFATYIKVANSWVKISDERILEMQGVTLEEKEIINQLDLDVQGLKSAIDDISVVHINETPPTDTSMLWVDLNEV